MTDNLNKMTLIYEELIGQPYQNCIISAGFVRGHKVDTLYLKFDRPSEEPTIIIMRTDEAAAIVYCIGGVLWSDAIGKLEAK